MFHVVCRERSQKRAPASLNPSRHSVLSVCQCSPPLPMVCCVGEGEGRGGVLTAYGVICCRLGSLRARALCLCYSTEVHQPNSCGQVCVCVRMFCMRRYTCVDGGVAVQDDAVFAAVLCSEDDIAVAILRLLELEKAVVEGAGATGLAACLTGDLRQQLQGKK